MAQASIITIGDELLIGQVIDTNSAWMAQQLNLAGIDVITRVAVGDNREEIIDALNMASAKTEIILITGGLGPTADDITKPLLCEYFGGKLVADKAALENVSYLFREVFKRPLTERNIKQAEVPDVCTVIQNPAGTAPGMLFRKENKVFISMPGVPFEMQEMMRLSVIPLLKKEYASNQILHKTLVTAGIGESNLADFIQDIEEQLPSDIKLAYLPNFSMVRLRLTGTAPLSEPLEALMNEHFQKLKTRTADFLVAEEDITLTQVLGKILLDKKLTMCTAESCTGGYIAHQITSLPGSSDWYDGSVVSYSNKVKENVLGVNEHDLLEHGAVSEKIVLEMLQGGLGQIGSNFGIAISGIMGPGGATAGKPVGTVWIAVGTIEKARTKLFHLRFDRLKNIQAAAFTAQNMLREFILERNEESYNTHSFLT